MKRKSLVFTCLLVLSSAVAGFHANAQNLALLTTRDGLATDQFAPGEYIMLEVALDNAAGVAGCAFTVNYDAEYLNTPYQISSAHFTFSYSDVDGTHSEIMHREYLDTGKINIIGANIGADGGSPFTAADNPMTVFTIAFLLDQGTPIGTTINFSLEPTRLNNPVAGYNDETKPVLVGAVSSSSGSYGGSLADDFPVLLGSGFAGDTHSIEVIPAQHAINGIVSYSGSKNGTLYVTAYEDHTLTIVADQVSFPWDAGTMTEQEFTLMVRNGTYYIHTYLDTDGSGDAYVLEPQYQVPESIVVMDSDMTDTLFMNLSSFTVDIDGNGSAEGLRDGILVIRYLLGYNVTKGADWIDGAYDGSGTRNTAELIETYIVDNMSWLDIDGNGRTEAYRDAFLLIRYLMDYPVSRGSGWIDGAYDPGGTRTSPADIERYIEFTVP